ncbi:MAG: DNA polymerase III subunit beta [Ruminococcus sp.]|nr:DNA polymerase III subunit beta [Ruminococcus sp.]
MKFTCSRTDLSNAVTNVQRAVATKSSIPSLEGILIKAYDGFLNLSGYDLEIGITTDVEAQLDSEGEIVVSARLFGDIIRKLPEEVVTIETDERMVTYITSGNASYQIVGLSATEYPDLPKFEETDKIVIKGGLLRDMIRQTIYAVSDNTSKPIYTGSLFEIKDKVLTIVAIDGYRMAIRKEAIDSDSENSFVIPKKTQSEVLKLITDDEENVEIVIGQRHTLFKVGSFYVISRLIEGQFIDYNSTIPKGNDTEVVVNTREIGSSVERMSLLANEKIPSPVKCVFSDDEIKMTCKTSMGKANDVISTTIAGSDVEIGFNNRYLLDAIKNCDTDEVKLILNGGLSPMIIKPVKSDSFLYLVVPMRISQ